MVVVLLVVNGFAQIKGAEHKGPDSCESIYLTLETLSSRIGALTDKDGVLVVIAGSQSAKDAKYDHLRIKRLTKYLVNSGLREEKIIWGIGPRSQDRYSYMKFYLEGRLLKEMKLTRRSMLCNSSGGALPQ